MILLGKKASWFQNDSFELGQSKALLQFPKQEAHWADYNCDGEGENLTDVNWMAQSGKANSILGSWEPKEDASRDNLGNISCQNPSANSASVWSCSLCKRRHPPSPSPPQKPPSTYLHQRTNSPWTLLLPWSTITDLCVTFVMRFFCPTTVAFFNYP